MRNSHLFLERFLKHTIAVIAFVLLGALLMPISASALGVAGFDLYRPNRDNPDAAFHYRLEPSASLEDQVIIKNTTTDTVRNLRVYIADGVATRNGGITLKDREASKTGLAKWISIDVPETISLNPNEERLVKFKLTVPRFSESDEQIAGIVVEPTEAVKDPNKGQFMINVLPRAAILITQRLPGPALKRLEIIDFNQKWATKERSKVFKLAVKNTGNIHLRPKGRIDIYNLFGNKTASLDLGRMATVFPKAVSRPTKVWKKPPVIGYFTAQAIVNYKAGASEQYTIKFLIFPWWILPIILVLWIIVRELRKRRAAKRLKEIEEEKAIQAAATLETLEDTVETIASKKDFPAMDDTVSPLAVKTRTGEKTASTKTTTRRTSATKAAAKTATVKSTKKTTTRKTKDKPEVKSIKPTTKTAKTAKPATRAAKSAASKPTETKTGKPKTSAGKQRAKKAATSDKTTAKSTKKTTTKKSAKGKPSAKTTSPTTKKTASTTKKPKPSATKKNAGKEKPPAKKPAPRKKQSK